jgi:hypothetical protein
MSNVAYARPTRPQQRAAHSTPRPAAVPRHVEIITTRAQRRARPRVAYAVVAVVGLFAIFAAQLLLSIVVSDGAYQISSLQSQQKQLLRTQENLNERLDLRDSTQFLAASAAKLGMVPGATLRFIDLQTGAVTAAPGTTDPTGCGGSCNLVANSLLTGVPLLALAPGTAQAAGTTTTGLTGAPATTVPAPPPAAVTTIPAPVTH